ncbi:MAG: hypothetical protein AAGE52_13885 [Myxococcota bacterium]
MSEAQTLLDQAQRVVDAGEESLRGVWPLAAAALTRQALESYARGRLTEHGARVDEIRFGALMLATQAVMDRDQARELTQLWAQLSECLHHTELGTTLDVAVAVERARALISEV